MNWETLGFQKEKDLFIRAVGAATLDHAYIFSGQDMIGKKTLAKELAYFINKQEYNPVRFNPDILFIEANQEGRSIGIDEIRKVKNFVYSRPYIGPKKFVIIDDGQFMTIEAQNSLLKVLEEPTDSSVIILVCPNSDLLLPTVVSRCQEIKFSGHSRKIVADSIRNSYLSKKDQEFLAEVSSGRVGFSINTANNKTFETMSKDIRELANLAKSDINERLRFAQAFSDERKEELKRKIVSWTLYSHLRINEPKMANILRGLFNLNKTLSQPQFNSKLALENFLIQI